MIKVVTDSASDIPEELIRQNDISIVPLYIHVGNQEYQDGVNMTRQEFYERLPHFKPAPTTAAPSVDRFRKIYDSLAAQGATEILSIHISKSLSSTLDSAIQAAKETVSARVTVLDSDQLSLGTGFLAVSAARMAAAGHSMTKILEALKDQIARTYVFAALDTLEYLQRSGRMNGAVAAIGSLLQIKPILKMYAGKPTAENVRTRKNSLKKLTAFLNRLAPFEKVAVVQSQARDQVDALITQVRHLLPVGEILITDLNPVLGSHIGPGVIGFVCITHTPKGAL